MNAFTTLILAAGITFSGASFAGSTFAAGIQHESLYDPAYLTQLSNDALGGNAANVRTGIAAQQTSHESTYDPAYLTALSRTQGGRTGGTLVINHESTLDPAHLRSITRMPVEPNRSAALSVPLASISCPQHESTFDACHLKSLQS